MDLYVTALNSGSNGNCYYIGNEEEAVLVDAGISCREIEKRMKRLDLSIYKVKALFISHEHSDHIRGIRVLSKKFNLPVYITPGTLQHSGINPDNPLVNFLESYKTVRVGNLWITAFPKFHDARDPQSFIIKHNEVCVGVFTDIGASCEHVIKHFKCCHAIFLEANYDPVMLSTGNYPYHLKRRISGGRGHLSNQQALELFLQYKPAHMSHVFLSHLSKENNDPALAFSLFEANAQGVKVVLTSRNEEIPVYKISHQLRKKEQIEIRNIPEVAMPYTEPGLQMSLNF
ncbi:MBL fold metallo-hydrolase [soil metagenome]